MRKSRNSGKKTVSCPSPTDKPRKSQGVEANLHPSWQVEIARTLFELSRLGVNVLITTHSDEILKFIEVKTGENPESKKLVELNHFSSDGVNNYEDDFDSNLAKIKEELTGPYASLYFAGL